MAMTRPDRELISRVMLFSQGFRTAKSLASQIVPFFNLCDEQLSPQPHYDFGPRARPVTKSTVAAAAAGRDAKGYKGMVFKRPQLVRALAGGETRDGDAES